MEMGEGSDEYNDPAGGTNRTRVVGTCEVKEAELKLVQAEFKTLQAQINPHFLYNTLDLINWMAIKYDCPDIESLIYSLSRFYKLSLRKGADIVTIQDEIMHIQTYLQIQNYRFENCVRLELDIESSIQQFKIPKITLHPLVENANARDL